MSYLAILVGCSAILLGCRSVGTEPVPTDEPLAIRIVTTMPGNTEGMPQVRYTFRALHSPLAGDTLEYLWDFDTTYIRTQTPAVDYAFADVGWYRVTVTLFRGSRAIGSGGLLVNIRRDPPSIRMVKIPAGTFLRGSTRVDLREQPVVRVRISQPLYISVYEVTQPEWEQVMGTSPAYFRGATLPVSNISWMEAVDFCNRLSIRLGYRPCYRISGDSVECDWSADGFRLPTEAEWEYAARAGTTTDVYTGNLADPYAECLASDTLEQVLDRIAWYCKNSDLIPHPVGLKEPNPWGLYDIIGNVSEFVWDWDSGRPYSPSDTLDPRGPSWGVVRYLRGGSFLEGARENRAAARTSVFPPSRRKIDGGIRLVRRAE